MESTDRPLSRRAWLATVAGAGVTTTAGCLDLLGTNGGGGDGSSILELTIKAPPSDEDPAATEIARRLTEHLDEIGVDVSLMPRLAPQRYQDVHIEGDFQLVVSRTPRITDPDDLRPMLHSDFAEETGEWLNPFGLIDETTDELLDKQRVLEGVERQQVVSEFQEHFIDETYPFAPVIVPDELTAVTIHMPLFHRPAGTEEAGDILGLEHVEGRSTLRIGILEGQVTENLNPLTGQYVGRDLVTGLLYDPLIRIIGDRQLPWAAREVAWTIGVGDRPDATVRLREGLTWHDGEPVTPEDVQFTYEFLGNLADGEANITHQASAYASQISLVDSVELTDDDSVKFTFVETTKEVAERVFNLPLFPEHIWQNYHGFDEDAGVPEPLTVMNHNPVGSGPFELLERNGGSYLVLERYEGHLPTQVHRDEQPGESIERVELIVPTHPPSIGTAVNHVADGNLDLISHVPHDGVRTVLDADAVSLISRQSKRLYIIGFNVRRTPTDDLALRHILGRLIDRTFIVPAVFRAYAAAADSPMAGTRYIAPSLVWEDRSVLGSFPGSGGFIDVHAARSLFEDAGYEYDESRDVILLPE